MITVKINKINVQTVSKDDVESQVNALNDMTFLDFKNLHKSAIDNAVTNNLNSDDYLNVVSVYLSMNNIKVNDVKWFRIESSSVGIICCHGTEQSDNDIIQSMLVQLS
ncbi:hypothetical protein [Photobacterium iliopiscarium]|uniref:hypothetical protein n=1 Tax=Photobacterium iliopiscarium TaxID=56192 RepID=UPI000D17C016|nr:hypothetical protein [Photobacterium iliopiscarium]PSU01683.1 hypothetical protein C9I85_00460 [Photobacterium iliopiscarium]PSV83433.1 hypothetical protein C9J51_09065 [Photobacterium iliopiscarium]